jgi:hypothetical protein
MIGGEVSGADVGVPAVDPLAGQPAADDRAAFDDLGRDAGVDEFPGAGQPGYSGTHN